MPRYNNVTALMKQWATNTTTDTSWTTGSIWTTSSTATATIMVSPGSGNYIIGGGSLIDSADDILNDFDDKITKIEAGEKELHLPDGTKLIMDELGNYQIVDKDAKIIYRGCRIREFNKYVNAGDLIEEFIKYVGTLGVTQGQVLKIPLNVFFTWLIMKSAIEDEVDIPSDVPRVESMQEVRENIKPRCKHCKRFLSMKKYALGINFCSENHLGRFMDKNKLLLR